MHILFNHIKKYIKIILFSILSIFFVSSGNAELTVEDIVKSRQALFSKNYSTAKRVQAFSSKGDYEKAKKHWKTALSLEPNNETLKKQVETLLTPEEIENISDSNRLVGFPYTKYLNSMIRVNMASSLVLMSEKLCKKLKIPQNKKV